MFLQQQDVRLEGVRKVIEDVDNMVNSGTELTKAFGRLKLKALQDNWGRFQTANEEAVVDRSKLPEAYFGKITDCDSHVERVSLQLEVPIRQQHQGMMT